MQRGLLMSILLATLVIPIWNARRRDFARGLRRTVVQMSLFVTLWTLCCLYLYWYL